MWEVAEIAETISKLHLLQINVLQCDLRSLFPLTVKAQWPWGGHGCQISRTLGTLKKNVGKNLNDKKITSDLHKPCGRSQELCSLLKMFLFSRKLGSFLWFVYLRQEENWWVKHPFLIPPVFYPSWYSATGLRLFWSCEGQAQCSHELWTPARFQKALKFELADRNFSLFVPKHSCKL